jgi:hypothetical protein
MRRVGICLAVNVFLSINWLTSGFSETNESIKNRQQQRQIWELGTEISRITYKEPGVMREKGAMYGILGSYTFHGNFMYKLDGEFTYGRVDYVGSGTISNVADCMLESRSVIGFDHSIFETSILTPYIGLGSRYLRDDTHGRTSSTGAHGYLRESNYIYSPVGLEAVTDLKNGWAIGATSEYDFFWWGRQYSADFDNRQKNGYGLRGSVKLQKNGKELDFILEPFIKYWNIKESKHNSQGYEPKNNSTEIGCRLSVKF